MGKCLVTKLKEVVQNDNLPKFGYASFKVARQENFDLYYIHDEATVVYLKGLTYNGLSEINLSAGQTLTLNASNVVFTSNDAYIEVYKYGKITSLTTRSLDVDVDELKYGIAPNGYYIGNGQGASSYGSVKGSLESIYNAILAAGADINNVKGVYIGVDTRDANYDFVGDVSNIGKDFKVKMFSMFNQYGLTGSFNNMGYSADKITRFACPYGIGENSVTLDIETFVAKARKVGAVTKTLTIYYAKYIHITFNGEEVILTTDNATLSWTASTITYNGVTINNSDVEP